MSVAIKRKCACYNANGKERRCNFVASGYSEDEIDCDMKYHML